MLIYNAIYAWEGWGGMLRLGSGQCWLRLYDLRQSSQPDVAPLKSILALVSDVPDSPLSVRSCSSHIATRLAHEFGVNPQRTLFIEYYPEEIYGVNQEHRIVERYDAVDFTWEEGKAFHPRYRTLQPPLLDAVKAVEAAHASSKPPYV